MSPPDGEQFEDRTAGGTLVEQFRTMPIDQLEEAVNERVTHWAPKLGESESQELEAIITGLVDRVKQADPEYAGAT
jgi:hypothetical protein